MRMRDVLTLVMGLATMAIIMIGLLDFDLMIEVWVKVFIGFLFAGALIGVAKSLLTNR